MRCEVRDEMRRDQGDKETKEEMKETRERGRT
jgi:hypothetical protein